MIRSAHPMGSVMVWSRHHPRADLRATLSHLPEEWVVAPLGPTHLVLGPTGAHVVAIDDGRDETPALLARLATEVRTRLAEHVALMPFVHALLVGSGSQPCAAATRIPPALLSLAIVDGPPMLTGEELDRIRICVIDGSLADLHAFTEDRVPH